MSEQMLVDCDTTSMGCSGGNVSWANTYLKKKATILENDYPYTAADGTCQYDDMENTGIMTTGTNSIRSKSPDSMKDALALSPISVGI